MRHLGTVQKKGMRVAELELFAREEGEYTWRSCQRQLVVDKNMDRAVAEKLSRLGHGAMVVVEVNELSQLQRVDEAEEQLVPILQGFGRQLEGFKNQAQEIETWRESLQYQADVLRTREEEWQLREQDLLTEISQLRAGNGASNGFQDIQEQWIQLEAERQELLMERQRLSEQICTVDPATLSELQRELIHLDSDFQHQSATAQQALNELAQFIEQHLNQLQPQLEELTEALVLCQQEQEVLAQQGVDFAHQEATLLEQQRHQNFQQGQLQAQAQIISNQRQEPSFHSSLTLVQALLVQSGAVNAPVVQVSPAELELRRRRLGEQQREYLQRAHLVLQQDEERRLQSEQLAELQQQLAQLQAEGEDTNDVEDEIDFLKQSSIDLKDSVARQKARLAQDEAELNRERTVLEQLVAQMDGKPPQVENPHLALVPDLQALALELQTLQAQTTTHLNQQEQRLLEQREVLAQQQQQWQAKYEQFREQKEQYTQALMTYELQRTGLEVRRTTLQERGQVLETQRAMLLKLHAQATPKLDFQELSSRLAALAL